MKLNKTKIVATVGPQSESRAVLKKLMMAGVDVFRINFSHASYKEIKASVKSVRALSEELNVHVSILGDLQGPKIRLGLVKKDVSLKKGSVVKITTKDEKEGDESCVSINYSKFPLDVNSGEKILINDGKLILQVLSSNKKDLVEAKVLQGGALESRKGVNLPNTIISLPSLTKKDKEDAFFAIKNGFDWIALSFVRSKKDVSDLKKLITAVGNSSIPIIAKIEKPEAIHNIDGILKTADGIMVARGDLGLEIPSEEVPLNQKLLVIKAKKARKPVIIATQMMESMLDSLTPSRAEVNDVANSVMDGADALMLSGETSVGKFPVEVVKTMEKIINRVESSPLIKIPYELPKIKSKRLLTKTVCFHACNIANEISASAICTLTNSGYTAWQISSWRPNAMILVFTSNRKILAQLNLLWGVKCMFYNNFVSTDDTIEEVNQLAKQQGFIKKNDFVINLSAMPIVKKGEVNTLRVSKI
ncbi:MAG: pyruvate kinase [Flavobacteriaceae bacterium]|nr:pyruvate kinase [Flavobacteriaceae bacterium]|tara:strand:- start:4904 stop:6328 length:1425 start_codon:yes stop_codon:yes gene_type:complete